MDAHALIAPEPVTTVEASRVAGIVPLGTDETAKLDGRVEAYVGKLMDLHASSPEFGRELDKLTSFGQREIAAASMQASRFLDNPARRSDDASVGRDLARLREVVVDLDPGGRRGLTKVRRILGFIPIGDGVKDYFSRYRTTQAQIASILRGLADGKDGLLHDNAAIDGERERTWRALGQLEQMVYMARALDRAIEGKASDLKRTDPDKARTLREEGLFRVRQREQDLLTQMAVSIQGYLALDLVKKNNVELIKGIDRASTTTVGALRTAVTVAQALMGQKLVLDQIGALNSTVAGIVDATGDRIRRQSADAAMQGAGPPLPVETLKTAFRNVYDTMDMIEGFRAKALEAMKTTMSGLDAEIEGARRRLAQERVATPESRLLTGAM